MTKWVIGQADGQWIVSLINETPNSRTTGMTVLTVKFNDGFGDADNAQRMAQEYFDWKTQPLPKGP